jgi:hypothetical protein
VRRDELDRSLSQIGRRVRITGNTVGVLAVVTALASTLVSFYPLNATANCYVATRPQPAIVAAAFGLGLVALGGWLYLLSDRVVYKAQLAACGALAIMIVVILAVPALAASGQYGPITAPSSPWPCSFGVPYVVLAAMSAFVPLVAGAVEYVFARWLPPSRWSLPRAALGGVAVWVIYLLWIYLL